MSVGVCLVLAQGDVASGVSQEVGGGGGGGGGGGVVSQEALLCPRPIP